MRIGALEAGGTKMVCAVVEDGQVVDRVSLPTRSPAETMPEMIEYFAARDIEALGVGSFGPLDLDRNSPTWGYITATPKDGWRFYDLAGELQRALKVPVALDTDVNCAALGEARFGSCQGLDDCVYITVGTGIGMGVLCGGRLVHGMQHPELGHVLVAPVFGDSYEGCCPYHGRCLEGMASGSAMRGRWGKPAQELADRPEVWQLEAEYLAQGIVTCILAYAPRRIVLGGGVPHQPQLLPLVRKAVTRLLAGYVSTNDVKDMESYIVAPALNDDQALLGCYELVRDPSVQG